MTTDYPRLPGLDGVYLEDSYVTAIHEGDERMTFDLDAVLTPPHPRYRDPIAGEQYCYAAATLMFDSVTRVEWVSRASVRSVDADGLADLGNIDSMVRTGDAYRLVGDWGEVVVHSRADPRFAVTDLSTDPA